MGVEIETQLRDPTSDYFLDPKDYKKPAAYEDAIRAELEERDYYLEKNVFWVPTPARWKTLQDSAKLPVAGRHQQLRFGNAALVSGQLGLEIGSAFLQELALLAPRNALESVHHLSVFVSDELRAAHALDVEQWQFSPLHTPHQLVVALG